MSETDRCRAPRAPFVDFRRAAARQRLRDRAGADDGVPRRDRAARAARSSRTSAGRPRDARAAARAPRRLRRAVPHPLPRRRSAAGAAEGDDEETVRVQEERRGDGRAAARRRDQRIRRGGDARRGAGRAPLRPGATRARPCGASRARPPRRLPRRRELPAHARAARRRRRPAPHACATARATTARCCGSRRLKRRLAAAQAAAADRRLRLDEGAHGRESAARACAGAGGAAGRGLHLRHAAHARDAADAAQAPRAGARRARRISSATGTAARASATRCRRFSPCRASPATRAAPRSLDRLRRPRARRSVGDARRGRQALAPRLAAELADAARDRRATFTPQTEALVAISPLRRRHGRRRLDARRSSITSLSLRAQESGVIAIVDGHHHIWRQADLPWLVGPMQPRIFGPYEPIRRDYPIDEYLADIAGSGVVKSVYVQTNWAKRAFRGRGRLGAADRTTKPAGRTRSSPTPISPPTTCARSSTGSRAIRWCAACACNCTGTRTRCIASPRAPISAPIPTIRRNIARLADYGWSFDLQVFAPQMAGAARSCRSLPERDLRAAARRHARGPLARRDARHGAPAWCASRRARTSSPSSRGSARSFIATIPRHIAEVVARDGRDVRRGALPVRLELSDREALDLVCATSSTPIATRREPLRRSRSARRSCTTRRCASIASRRRARAEHKKDRGGQHGAGNQDPRLWRHRAGIELSRARPRLRPHAARADARLSDPRRRLSGRRRHRLSLQPDHGDARHARAAVSTRT